MEALGKLLVTDFIDKKADYLESVVTQIETEGMSFNKKSNLILEVMMKGVEFGIAKGGFVEKCRKEKIDAASEKSYRKWLTEMAYEINEGIEAHMKKVKYKKNK